MLYEHPLSKHWQLAPFGGAESVTQGVADIDLCIRHILSTRKGEDVTRPEFGSNYFDYLDTPEDIFIPNAVREVVLAIQTWEKRAVVERVQFSGNAPHMVMTVLWRVDEAVAGTLNTTAISLGRAAWI